jgi:hypothetical protein
VSNDSADLRAEVEALTAERTELWGQVTDRRALEREIQDLRAQIDYMESTASWRLTVPLRLVKRAVHQLKVLRASRGL